MTGLLCCGTIAALGDLHKNAIQKMFKIIFRILAKVVPDETVDLQTPSF
jgi:hypothetical protein